MACEVGFAGTGVFAGIAEALSNLLGLGSCGAAGFILGFIIIVVLVIALSWLIGQEAMKGFGVMIPASIGFLLSVLFGWWPVWTVIVFVLILALVIIKPFGSGGE